MGIRAIYEAEQDGSSVVIWEAQRGTRICYWTPRQAENAANWLIAKANQFHAARDSNGGNEDELMITIIRYTSEHPDGESVTEFQLVHDFINRARNAGFEIQSNLERSEKEAW